MLVRAVTSLRVAPTNLRATDVIIMLPARPPTTIDTRRVRSLDTTEIAYHITDAPFPGAPVVVLANGLGGTWLAWRGQIEYLADRCRFLTWDYRGLYGSRRPSNDADDAYGVDRHVQDLHAILAAEKIERVALVGWSLGVQVALETFRRAPGRISGLVLINGTYGRPLDTLTPLPGVGAVIPPILDVLRRAHPLATRVTRRTLGRPGAAAWLKRLGIVGKALDDEVLAELIEALGELELEPYFRLLKAAGDHDAARVLGSINVPALVIAGDRDPLTPRPLAQQMARRIPEAEILVVPGGTHYVPVEYPDLVSLRIERFFRDHGIA
ncbi:Alpha/beta hydrolase fold-1 precursor [Minicystis rosea]|nr:Alpha/beta hydrolase fold-1 precursor [Minicystis rosea]